MVFLGMFQRKPAKRKTITVSGIPVEVVRKKVQNINMRVYPSKREVRISAPWYLRMEVIREFAESKREWIQKHLAKYKEPVHPAEPDFISGEKHLYRGEELELKVVTHHAPPKVILRKNEGLLEMRLRHGSDKTKRAKLLKEWYRARLKEEIPKLIEKWEGPMGVSVNEFGVKQMKTRWGSCNIRAKRIWLNLELAKKSPACLESVVVHEMVHLLERLHNDRFYALMDGFYPQWREAEKELQGRVD